MESQKLVCAEETAMPLISLGASGLGPLGINDIRSKVSMGGCTVDAIVALQHSVIKVGRPRYTFLSASGLVPSNPADELAFFLMMAIIVSVDTGKSGCVGGG